jgi:hypothetical protein
MVIGIRMLPALRHLALAFCLGMVACSSFSKADVAQMRFVEAAGISTHVETWGDGNPVLLIHGASSHIGTWRPTIVPLLKGRN